MRSVQAKATPSNPVHWITANDHAPNLSSATIANIQYQNRDLSDTETSDLPNLLPLLEGHEYIITSNLGPELNISKATKCTLIKIAYPLDSLPPSQDGSVNVFPDILPQWVEVRLHSPLHNVHSQWPGSFDENHQTITLIPIQRSIKVDYRDRLGKTSLALNQPNAILPSPSRRFTIYRGQGQTMEKLVTTLTLAKKTPSVLQRSVYGPIKGPRLHLPNLHEDSIPREAIDLQPPKDIVSEIRRVEAVAERTKSEVWQYFPTCVQRFYEKMMATCKS
ncbi:hypothetical protein BC829DRAFT_420673 [Chytridium lagenaria]|nr:hypothetical protein BC829DRAFT_420673 [Chytridium lagenaria]